LRKNSLNSLLLAGDVFVGSTGFTGGTTGAAIDTQAPLALYNPAGSGRRVYLIMASYSYVSGAPGTGTHWLCYNDTVGQAAPTGTSTPIKPGRMMSTATSVCTVLRDATLPNAPNVYIPMGPQDATGGGFRNNVIYYDGYIQVDPGGILSWQFAGSASNVSVFGFIWTEVPTSGGDL
jgi:hypothetical protein